MRELNPKAIWFYFGVFRVGEIENPKLKTPYVMLQFEGVTTGDQQLQAWLVSGNIFQILTDTVTSWKLLGVS